MITITVKKRNGNYLEFVSKGHAAPVRRNAEPAKSAVLLIWTLTVIPLSQENVSAATPARESARRGTSGSGFRRRKMRAFFKHELGKDGRTLLENKRK